MTPLFVSALAVGALPAPQTGYAPVNGLQLYYEIRGDGPPLVLIHGGGSTIESNWARILPLLAKSHRVIAIEEQGHGHTRAIDRPFTFENSADDVAALLDHLKIDRADLFGSAMADRSRSGLRIGTRTRSVSWSSLPHRSGGMEWCPASGKA